ncbi:MAG: 16S rRNA (uracil(1498)-N(3))-methyltransferase [Desulfarculales bacterium]|nr:16S rRNA (uracil(1498)-N(3))-methyltransferase [Desulfarculales bacterium]
MSARRFLVSPGQLKSELIILEPGEAGHAQRVLRLQAGDEIWLLDGLGNQARAVVERLNPMLCRVRERPPWPSPRPRIIMLLAVSKNQAMDILAQKLTELMVDEIRLFNAARSVAEAGGSKNDRWERLAGQALKQCGAARAPRFVAPPYPNGNLDEVLGQAPPSRLERALKIAAYEGEQKTNLAQIMPLQAPEEVWVIIGPEGGLSKEEIELAQERGFVSCRLTSSILRSETAALVTAGCLRCHWE